MQYQGHPELRPDTTLYSVWDPTPAASFSPTTPPTFLSGEYAYHMTIGAYGMWPIAHGRMTSDVNPPGAPFMIHIRPAVEADFEAILQVQQAAFGEYATVYEVSAWTTETLDSLRQDAKEKRIFVAETDGLVVGSVRCWTVAGVCVIRLLSVNPAHQKHGVGAALMREIERATADAHKFYACTMLRTARNVQFFLTLGYKAETLLPDHYHHLDLICFAKYRESAKTATLPAV